MFKEFKEFIVRGSVMGLAIGIVIGAAFGKIVTSFVSDILMPPIGLLLGNVDFTNLFINLSRTHYDTLKAAKDAGAATLNYGVFLGTLIEFLMVAFAIFLVVRRPIECGARKERPGPLLKIARSVCQASRRAPQMRALRLGFESNDLRS